MFHFTLTLIYIIWTDKQDQSIFIVGDIKLIASICNSPPVSTLSQRQTEILLIKGTFSHCLIFAKKFLFLGLN